MRCGGIWSAYWEPSPARCEHHDAAERTGHQEKDDDHQSRTRSDGPCARQDRACEKEEHSHRGDRPNRMKQVGDSDVASAGSVVMDPATNPDRRRAERPPASRGRAVHAALSRSGARGPARRSPVPRLWHHFTSTADSRYIRAAGTRAFVVSTVSGPTCCRCVGTFSTARTCVSTRLRDCLIRHSLGHHSRDRGLVLRQQDGVVGRAEAKRSPLSAASIAWWSCSAEWDPSW